LNGKKRLFQKKEVQFIIIKKKEKFLALCCPHPGGKNKLLKNLNKEILLKII